MTRTAGVLFFALFLGCHGPHPLPPTTRVAVVEFSIAQDATITRCDASPDQMGREIAERLAALLREEHQPADFVPAGAKVPEADLIVTGEVTRIDGGSTAERTIGLVLTPIVAPAGVAVAVAGHATVGVMGELRQADGSRKPFSDERVGGGREDRHSGGRSELLPFLRDRDQRALPLVDDRRLHEQPGVNPGVQSAAGGPSLWLSAASYTVQSIVAAEVRCSDSGGGL